MLKRRLSDAAFRHSARGVILASTGNRAIWIGNTHPVIRRMVLLSAESIDFVCLDLDHTGQQYSVTE